MDGQYSWKRTEDIEIDFMNLLHRFLGQWKQILACALVFAVAGAGFGYVKNRSSTGVSEAVTAEETELTETELQNVKDAAALEAEIRGLEEYMGNSILMQIDPYNKHMVILLYSIDHAKRIGYDGVELHLGDAKYYDWHEVADYAARMDMKITAYLIFMVEMFMEAISPLMVDISLLMTIFLRISCSGYSFFSSR